MTREGSIKILNRHIYNVSTEDPEAIYMDIPYSVIVEVVKRNFRLQRFADSEIREGKRKWTKADLEKQLNFIEAKNAANKIAKQSRAQEAGPSLRAMVVSEQPQHPEDDTDEPSTAA